MHNTSGVPIQNQYSSAAQAACLPRDTVPPSQTILSFLSELTDQSVQLGMMAGEVVNALVPPMPEDGKCSPPLPKPGCVTEYLDLIRVQMNVADMYLRQTLQAIGGGNVSESTKRG